jgi:nucleotide-binding universal stress UspA family protein
MMHDVQLRSILVGVDFSGASAAAVAAAAELAAAFAATLRVVHTTTLDAPPYFTPAQTERLEAEHRASLSAARSHLEEYVRQFAGSIEFTSEVVDGDAEDVLVATRDVDLIAVGTHGRRGPRRWWLGSVAERVAAGAAPAVLVAHGDARRTLVGGPILAVNAKDSPIVHAWARALAARLGSQVLDAEDVATCPADRLSGAALVVMARSAGAAAGALPPAATARLRACRVPMLFVADPH